jgi:hypothetical protein
MCAEQFAENADLQTLTPITIPSFLRASSPLAGFAFSFIIAEFWRQRTASDISEATHRRTRYEEAVISPPVGDITSQKSRSARFNENN